MDVLEDCHSQLGRLLGSEAEPVEVLRCAEEHRAYWRPRKVRVLLLAESHVYTAASELDRRVDLSGFPGTEVVPSGFVRLVYCLGYGGNKLLNQSIPKNFGTPQYWKLFYSCLNRVHTNNDFVPILSRTPFAERIQNKLDLLRRLQETGVWLLDTSLAALYLPGRPKPDRLLMEKCLRTSWDAYVGQVIRAARPSHIVCIGKGVSLSLGTRLSSLGIPMTVLPQPNARLSSTMHLQVFQTYHNIVSSTQ
jgi:hypothetical protein